MRKKIGTPGGDATPLSPGICGGLGMTRGNMMPGGASQRQDSRAPQTITSDDVTRFEIRSSFGALADPHTYDDINLYVYKLKTGSVAMFQARSKRDSSKNVQETCWFAENILPSLHEWIVRFDLVRNNGYSYHVGGLPEGFGGSVNIRYANGEYISKSSNQSPVIGYSEAERFLDLLLGAKETCTPVQAPPAAGVTGVRFVSECHFESKKDDSRTVTTLTRDGRGCRLESDAVYGRQRFHKEADLAPDVFGKVEEIVDGSSLTLWDRLPEAKWGTLDIQRYFVTLTMKDGREISFDSSFRFASSLRSPLFELSLYLDSLKQGV